MASATNVIDGPHEIVALDPLLAEGSEPMLELCQRAAPYRVYGAGELLDTDLARGLFPRHDTVANFLRTGGLHGEVDDPRALAARTAYFREEYAYGDTVVVPGIEGFLHAPGFVEAAQQVHDRPVVEPAIAYANLMVPGQELAVHTDVPEFRGANRKVLPQWLLVVMHHSGLFEDWRMPIATGISWFHDSEHGALAHWPDGPDGPVSHHRIRANTALVLDTDSVFHGVDRVADDSPEVLPEVPEGAELHHGGGDRWVVRGPDGEVVGEHTWDELRFSVSWKAYCFADEADRDRWRDHSEDLTEGRVLDVLVADLAERGLAEPDVARDRELGLLLIDTYVRFPPIGTAA